MNIKEEILKKLQNLRTFLVSTKNKFIFLVKNRNKKLIFASVISLVVVCSLVYFVANAFIKKGREAEIFLYEQVYASPIPSPSPLDIVSSCAGKKGGDCCAERKFCQPVEGGTVCTGQCPSGQWCEVNHCSSGSSCAGKARGTCCGFNKFCEQVTGYGMQCIGQCGSKQSCNSNKNRCEDNPCANKKAGQCCNGGRGICMVVEGGTVCNSCGGKKVCFGGKCRRFF